MFNLLILTIGVCASPCPGKKMQRHRERDMQHTDDQSS